MKLTKDIALMAIGAGMVMAYQKCKKPIKSAINNTRKKAVNLVNETSEKLEDMM